MSKPCNQLYQSELYIKIAGKHMRKLMFNVLIGFPKFIGGKICFLILKHNNNHTYMLGFKKASGYGLINPFVCMQ